MKHVNNLNEFKDATANGKVLIDFYAEWCGPCKMIAPILEELEGNVDFEIIKVDVDEAQDVAREFQIMSIPTLVKFEGGVEADKKVGFMPKDQILSWMK